MPKFIVTVIDSHRNRQYEITASSSGWAQRIAARRYQEEDYAEPFFSTIVEPLRRSKRT
jgi:hypothetical protein